MSKEIVLERQSTGDDECHHPSDTVIQWSSTNVCNHGNLSMIKVTGRKFCINPLVLFLHPLRPLRTFLSTQNNCSKYVSEKKKIHRSFSQLLFFPKILNIIFFLLFLIFLLAINYSVRLIFNIKSDQRREIFHVVLDPWICQRLVNKSYSTKK